MAFCAQRAQLAESAIVVLTWWESGLLAYVLVEAIVAVGAVAGAREGLTFGHAAEVIFM